MTSTLGDLPPPVVDLVRLRPDVGTFADRAPAGQVDHDRPAPHRVRLPLPARPHPQPPEERPTRRLCSAGSEAESDVSTTLDGG